MYTKLLFKQEFVKRKKPKNYWAKDKKYFENEFSRIIGEVKYFRDVSMKISGSGLIYNSNKDITQDYLSLDTLNNFFFIKKFYLFLKFNINKYINTKKNKKIIFLKKCIVLHNRSAEGYFHWINDIFLKLIYIEKKKLFIDYKIIIPSNLNKNFHYETLKTLNRKIYYLDNKNDYIIEKSLYLPQFSPSGNPRPKILKIAKTFMMNKLNKNKINNQNKNTHNLVYVSRHYSARRKIINEKELQNFLKRKNFQVVYLEKLNFLKQLNLFKNSKVVIGLHGAGLVNIFMMKKKSKLLELRQPENFFGNCFFSYSSILKIDYYYLLCKKFNYFKANKNSDYLVDLRKLEAILCKIL